MALTSNVFILCVFCFTLSFLCSLPYIFVIVGVISVIGGCWGCWGCSGFTLLIVCLTGCGVFDPLTLTLRFNLGGCFISSTSVSSSFVSSSVVSSSFASASFGCLLAIQF